MRYVILFVAIALGACGQKKSTQETSSILSAADVVELTCKQKEDKQLPDYAKSFEQFKGKKVTLKITRDTATIGGEGLDTLTAKADGPLPAEAFSFGKFDGKNIGLDIPTVAPYVGGKTATVRIFGGAQNIRNFSWDFSCQNKNSGKVASFIKICDKMPTLKPLTNCKALGREDETFGKPYRFNFKQENETVLVNFKDENDQVKNVKMKFYPMKNPGGSMRPKYLEYCSFSVQGGSEDFSSFSISRDLAEKGHGLALTTESASDGGAYIQYSCAGN